MHFHLCLCIMKVETHKLHFSLFSKKIKMLFHSLSYIFIFFRSLKHYLTIKTTFLTASKLKMELCCIYFWMCLVYLFQNIQTNFLSKRDSG